MGAIDEGCRQIGRMKLLLPPRKDQAMTSVEIVVVIVVILVLIAVLFPSTNTPKRKARRITCVNNLKQVGLALKIWEGNHNDYAPQGLSITNGGAKELLLTGNVAGYFRSMSAELTTPRLLYCPADNEHDIAVNFTNLSNHEVSYFVAPNAVDSQPNRLLFGDDNFAIDGVPLKSGAVNLWSNHSVKWGENRHVHAGNVALADGSVLQINNAGLANLLIQSGDATNLVVIP